MSEENTTKFRLDEKNLPRLSKSQARRLDSMSDEDIEIRRVVRSRQSAFDG